MTRTEAEAQYEPELQPVPAGWEVVPFEEAAEVVSDQGRRIKQRDYLATGKVPVIDQGQEYVGGYTDDEGLAFEGDLPVIVFGDHTRAVKYVDKPFAVGAEGVKILRPTEWYTPKFFYYLLRSLRIPSRGYSRHFQFLRKLQFPVASRNLQDCIVAEIEKQFSRLDSAVFALKRVQANLKRYRASVLKAACEGRLVPTEAELARAEGRDYEAGAQLLARILKERRAKWDRQGVNGRNRKYVEPQPPDTSDLAESPAGWTWATVEQLAEVQLGKMLDRQKHRSGRELPYLRNINVRWGSINSGDVLEMFFEDDELDRFGLKIGDVLVCEGGEPGRAAVWDGRLPGMKYQKALHRVRFNFGYEPNVLVFLLEYLAASGRLEKWFTGSTIKHFTRESFAVLPLPLPPFAEQSRIVAEVERRLSLAEELEAQVDANLQRAERLRQSILKRAFEGKLVPQDSNDEPASALLERIRAERAKIDRVGKLASIGLRRPSRQSSKAKLPE